MAQAPQDFQPFPPTFPGMEPSHPIALAALVRLHSELGGRILANRKEAKSLATDMKHVEAVIRMFDPGYDVRRIPIRRRNRSNGLFKRGTLFRAALDALRKAPEPMTTRELVEAMLAAKGGPDPSKKQLRGLSVAVQGILRNYNGRAVVRVGAGMPARWELKP
jgi:hypothetical protein